jgi:transposase
MVMTSRNSFTLKLWRRRGRTSPPLVNIHPNPGPKSKATRRAAKLAPDEHHLSKYKRQKILKLRAQGKSVEEIARDISGKSETVQRWIKRREETGELKPNRPGPKRGRHSTNETENRQKRRRAAAKLSEFEKGKIDVLLDGPMSHRKIGKKLNRSHTAVDNLAKRREEDPEMKRKSSVRPGPPRITDDRQDRMLARRADQPDEPSLRKMEREIKAKKIKPSPSRETIRRRLHEQSMDAFRQIPKPRLTKAQKARRLEWARAHENWTVAQWQRVLWSDESLFTRIPKIPRKFVWMRNPKPRDGRRRVVPDKRVAPRVRGGGGKINVWGCFYAGGVGNLKEIHGNMDAKQYPWSGFFSKTIAAHTRLK